MAKHGTDPMLLRAIATAAMLSLCSPTAQAVTPITAEQAAEITMAELMAATGLDIIFTQYGPGIERGPTEQGVPLPAPLAAVWTEAAREVFNAGAMHRQLAKALTGKLSQEETAALGRFFRSELGKRLTELERGVAMLDPAAQMVARDRGLELLEGIGEGSLRARQLDEMLDLVSSEIAVAMAVQTIRGMIMAMSLAETNGDLQSDASDVDAYVTAILPGVQAEIEATQRAMIAFGYQNLSDEEMEEYLAFLRTDPARKFYALATFAVGQVAAEYMGRFGERLVSKAGRVNV